MTLNLLKLRTKNVIMAVAELDCYKECLHCKARVESVCGKNGRYTKKECQMRNFCISQSVENYCRACWKSLEIRQISQNRFLRSSETERSDLQ